MFDFARFLNLAKKACRSTTKFKFEEAEKVLREMYALLDKADATTKRLGDIVDWSDVPAPVLWIDNSRKPPEVLEKIKALAAELACTCKSIACKCVPTSDANSNPKLRCRLCQDPLTGNDVAWVDSKKFSICGCCNDILFDVLYLEICASDKINDVIENALWWTSGERPQFPKALKLIGDAKIWCRLAADFSNAVK